jgi:hypothetical protein
MVEKMRNLRHCSIRNIYLANDWVQLLELLNKVCDLGFAFAYRVFGRCVGIAESGLVSAG